MAQEQLVRKLTADVLASIAPEELILVESYDPEEAAYGSTSRGPQGFGVEAIITLALPFIYKFFEKFVERLGTNLGDEVSVVAKRWLSDQKQTINEEKLSILIQAELNKLGMPSDTVPDAKNAIMMVLRDNAGTLLQGD